MMDINIETILDNISSIKDEILDYIESTEHLLFYWITNKEVQDFIREYPEDYEDKFYVIVCYASSSPLIRICFDEHPEKISYIEGHIVLSTLRESARAKWMEWNRKVKVKELQISEKEKELNYYKNMIDKTKKEIKELKEKELM